MATKLTIFFPRGGGGSWLGNLIWHLENNNFDLPQVSRVFDKEPGSQTVKFSHSFEIYHSDKPQDVYYYNVPENFVMFSTDCLFNMYLNDAFKVRYGLFNLDQQSVINQFFTLSDSMRFIWTNEQWKEFYCNKNDLDYKLIFQDPSEFAQTLIDILNRYNIEFQPNYDYIHKSIANYRSTCCDPAEVFGNLDSLIWLGCCHGVTMLKDIPLPITIPENVTQQELKELMEPFNDITKEYVKSKMFNWL